MPDLTKPGDVPRRRATDQLPLDTRPTLAASFDRILTRMARISVVVVVVFLVALAVVAAGLGWLINRSLEAGEQRQLQTQALLCFGVRQETFNRAEAAVDQILLDLIEQGVEDPNPELLAEVAEVRQRLTDYLDTVAAGELDCPDDLRGG